MRGWFDLFDHQRFAFDTVVHDKGEEDQEGQDEVEQGPSENRGGPRPKGGAVHGFAAFFGGKRGHEGLVRVGRGTLIALEFHVAAERKGGDLPFGAVFIYAAGQNGAKAQRKHLGLDAGPAAHDVVAVFVDGDDHREGDDKGRDGENQITKGRDQTGDDIQGTFVLLCCCHGLECAYTRHLVRLAYGIKGNLGISEAVA